MREFYIKRRKSGEKVSLLSLLREWPGTEMKVKTQFKGSA